MKVKTKWPCVFLGPIIRDEVNPILYDQFPKLPFGAFQRAWRKQHCATINPYGSESCPYDERDCAMAFLAAAEDAMAAKTSPVGLFRAIARSTGLRRSESKPLARYRIVRTDGHEVGSPDLRRSPTTGPDDDLVGRPGVPRQEPMGRAGTVPSVGAERVRGTDHRPQSIRSLLRGDGAGPRTHPYGWDERKATTDNDGDAGDPLSPPSPRRLGDQPPSGDPDLHQGGE